MDNVLRRCVREDEIFYILWACHDKPYGGHFVIKRTTLKVIHAGYYWPSIFKDAIEYIKDYDQFQSVRKRTKTTEMPLESYLEIEPFDKWGMNFIGPIKPSSSQNECLLVFIDYMKKWVEERPLKHAK